METHIYEISESERMELDRQAEQRAEVRFLLETYADQPHFRRISDACAQMRPGGPSETPTR